MPRMTAGKRSELESFWRTHLDDWRCSDLNQREYCELHGLPLKCFGNWRAKFKHEEPISSGKVLYRRGGGLGHMSSHVTKEIVRSSSGYIPSVRSAPPSAKTETTVLPVTLTDAADGSAEAPQPAPAPAPVIVERSAPGIEIEIELIGGRRVRFKRDVDPETVRRRVTLLEGKTP